FKKIPLRETILNIPNVLSLSRLIVSPFIGYFILSEQYEIALCAFVYAGVTDLLDGIIARHYNLKTMVGTVIDPLADKILMTILTITLAMKDLLPIPVATIILGRDFCLILASFYYRYISLPSPKTLSRYFDISIPSAEVRPTLISKVNTALQLVLMGTTLASPVFGWINVPFLKTL
ncbi:14198_t:CDS:2, partial [Dentiscutata heterogama]